jgi:glyoxylase-like metal-dependent hydrolase (beta-lactamase superfamily II)
VDAGFFKLDGGAMFGTVPKVLWSRLMPADELNRIRFASNSLLLRGEAEGRSRVVVVETGNGDKEDATFRERFALEGGNVLLKSLAALGVRPEDVTDVILTHLHFDHAGGATRREGERIVPTFPNARHVVQRQELEDARRPPLRSKASYLPCNWEPLEEAGLLQTVEGECDVLPGVRVRPMPGHNQGNQGVMVLGADRKLIYSGDLIPTHHHLQPTYVMGYDLDVNTCVEHRIRLLDEICETQDLLAFDHDPDIPAGMVRRDAKGRYVLEPVAL